MNDDRVEFVDAEPEPGASESPATPSRRRAVAVPVLVALAFTGFLAVRSLDHQTSLPVSAVRTVEVPAPRTSATPVRNRDPAHCPGESVCAVSAAVPVSVAKAVSAALPGSRVASMSTVRLRGAPMPGGLVYRQVNVKLAGTALEVDVTRPTAADRATSVQEDVEQTDARHREVEVRSLLRGFAIDVVAEGTNSSVPDVDALAQLSSDPALLTA